MFDRIKNMHRKLGADYDYTGPPRMLPEGENRFRYDFLQEELDEYIDAVNVGDMVKAYDALLDLIVVAYGCLVRHGFPYEPGMDAVMTANEQKTPGRNTSRNGHEFDLVKPAGWQGPESRLEAILNNCKHNVANAVGSPKDDIGKTAYGLVPLSVLEGVAKVFNMGRDKYGMHTWKQGLEWDRTYSALLRHLFKWWDEQEETDSESGLSHIDHALAQLMILRWYMLNNRGKDTRHE